MQYHLVIPIIIIRIIIVVVIIPVGTRIAPVSSTVN